MIPTQFSNLEVNFTPCKNTIIHSYERKESNQAVQSTYTKGRSQQSPHYFHNELGYLGNISVNQRELTVS